MSGDSSTTAEPTVHELFDLSGRVALVTGGTGYLGLAMARALAEAGASVLIGSRDRSKAVAAMQTLPVVGAARHGAVEINHMRPEDLPDRFEQAVAHCGQVDVLVNNGHEAHPNDWSTVTAAEFNRQLANATGYFELARLMRQHVVEREAAASIVMLGSMYGLVASYPDAYDGICPASPVSYHALKGGIIHMTRHLAAYWAADRIRVNCLSPGPFPPPRIPGELVERLSAKLPMHRMGRPQELKGAIVFLASDASSFMTGHNLVVDGGWTTW